MAEPEFVQTAVTELPLEQASFGVGDDPAFVFTTTEPLGEVGLDQATTTPDTPSTLTPALVVGTLADSEFTELPPVENISSTDNQTEESNASFTANVFSAVSGWFLSLFDATKAQAQSAIQASVLNFAGEQDPNIVAKLATIDGKTVIRVEKGNASFRPGRYTLVVSGPPSSGDFGVARRDFMWGVLAINTNKATYTVGEKAYLQFASLDEYGHTLCDSKLEVKLTNITNGSNAQTETFSTESDTITRNSTCGANNYTDEPDYFTTTEPLGEVGPPSQSSGEASTYTMVLTNQDTGYSITDKFDVVADTKGNLPDLPEGYLSLPFDVERVSTSRTNPFLGRYYAMTFHITANYDFGDPTLPAGLRGASIVETVPTGFIIIPSEEYEVADTPTGEQTITWHRSLKAGESITLRYTYDPPDVSPEIFTHGPLEFYQTDSLSRPAAKSLVFKEARGWQVASDASKTWDGGGTEGVCGIGAANNWSCATNWSDNIMPASGDTVTFDATSVKDSTIDAGFGGTVTILNINSGYTGIITQARSLTISTTFTQADGTFNGSADTIDLNGTFALSAGTFRSTSGTMYVASTFTISGTPTFTHNSGTVTFDSSSNITLTPLTKIFNNVTFNKSNNYYVTIADSQTLTIVGTTTLTDGGIRQVTIPASGSIEAEGNIVQASTFDEVGATPTVTITGTADQTFTGNATQTVGTLPNININKSSGTLTLAGTIRITGNWTYTAGTIDASTNNSTVVVGYSSNHGDVTITGSHTLYNVIFDTNAGSINLLVSSGTTLTVAGTLTFDNSTTGSTPNITTGTIAAPGDIMAVDSNR